MVLYHGEAHGSNGQECGGWFSWMSVQGWHVVSTNGIQKAHGWHVGNGGSP